VPVVRAIAEPEDEQSRPENQLQRSNREIPEKIGIEDPLEKAADMFQGEVEENAADPQIRNLVTIDRFHRYIDNDRTRDIQPEEQIGLKKITIIDLVEGQAREHRRPNGNEAVRRVHDIPVPRRKLAEKTEDTVTDQTDHRHSLKEPDFEKTIAFRVIRRPIQHGCDQVGDQSRVHLPVTVALDDDVRALRERLPEPGFCRPTDTSVLIDKQDFDSRVTQALRGPTASFGARVVHDIDPRNRGPGHFRKDLHDFLRDMKRGNNDSDLGSHSRKIRILAAGRKGDMAIATPWLPG